MKAVRGDVTASGHCQCYGTAGWLRAVGEFLATLQTRLQRQVIFEARIVEVTLADGFEQGIQWSKLDELGPMRVLMLTLMAQRQTISPMQPQMVCLDCALVITTFPVS